MKMRLDNVCRSTEGGVAVSEKHMYMYMCIYIYWVVVASIFLFSPLLGEDSNFD